MYYEVFKLHSELLKALSHSKRLEIINLLRDQELSVSQIQDMLGLPQANLSQHLQVLRRAEVTKTRKKGKEIYYRVAHKNFIKASDLLREVLIERYKGGLLSDEFTKKMSDLVPLTRDVVCGMRLSPKTASYAYRRAGHDYYFCAEGCLKKFKKNPEKFAKGQE
jgi:ArsR family transcriptional regulator